MFWRGRPTPDDVYARGLPKYLEALNDSPSCKIFMTSQAGNLGMVRYLISGGVDPSDYDYWMVKHAAERGHMAVVQCLVSAGARFRDYDDIVIQLAASRCRVHDRKPPQRSGAILEQRWCVCARMIFFHAIKPAFTHS